MILRQQENLRQCKQWIRREKNRTVLKSVERNMFQMCDKKKLLSVGGVWTYTFLFHPFHCSDFRLFSAFNHYVEFFFLTLMWYLFIDCIEIAEWKFFGYVMYALHVQQNTPIDGNLGNLNANIKSVFASLDLICLRYPNESSNNRWDFINLIMSFVSINLNLMNSNDNAQNFVPTLFSLAMIGN